MQGPALQDDWKGMFRRGILTKKLTEGIWTECSRRDKTLVHVKLRMKGAAGMAKARAAGQQQQQRVITDYGWGTGYYYG